MNIINKIFFKRNLRLVSAIFTFLIFFVSFVQITFSASPPTPSFSIRLNPNSQNQPIYSQCTYEADILIDTGLTESNSADIIINYNPSIVEIIDQNQSQQGIQIGQGTAYEVYTGNRVNTQEGKIKLTGFSISNNLTGFSTFGKIRFRPLNTSSTINFTVEYFGESINNTFDSNIADAFTSFDTLSSVENLNLLVDSGTCPLLIPPTPTIPIEISPTETNDDLSNNLPLEISISAPRYVDELESQFIQIIIDNVSYLDPNSLIAYLNDIPIDLNQNEITIKKTDNNKLIITIDSNALNKNNIDLNKELRIDVIAKNYAGAIFSESVRVELRQITEPNTDIEENSPANIIEASIQNISESYKNTIQTINNIQDFSLNAIEEFSTRILPKEVAKQITFFSNTTGGLGFLFIFGLIPYILPFVIALISPLVFKYRALFFLNDNKIITYIAVKSKLFKKPLPRSMVNIFLTEKANDSLIKKGKTNIFTGEFLALLEPNQYMVKIEKLGYIEVSQHISIAKDKNNKKIIYLEDDYLYNTIGAKLQFEILKFDAPTIVSFGLLILSTLNALSKPELIPVIIFVITLIVFTYYFRIHLIEYKFKIKKNK